MSEASEAFVMTRAGAGGVESHDWADMALSMYARWGERAGYECEVIGPRPDAAAGINSGIVKISGAGAYRRLKAEAGVHRLSRVSPHDPEARRHTSFIEVQVLTSPAAAKQRVGFGDPVRSYVVHPYKMVRDLRTGVTSYELEAVLDGDFSSLGEGAA